MDIRNGLNSRFERIIKEYSETDESYMESDPFAGNSPTSKLRREELHHIEQALATFQLADAQDRATEAQQAATREQARTNKVSEHTKSKSEEILFWSRRFITNLAIGNGAAFVAVLSFMLKSDSPHVPFDDVFKALQAFGVGTAIAAGYPVIRVFELWASTNRKRDEDGTIIEEPYRGLDGLYRRYGASVPVLLASLALFITGMGTVIGSAQGFYNAKPPYPPAENSSQLGTKTPTKIEAKTAPVTTPTVNPPAATTPVDRTGK